MRPEAMRSMGLCFRGCERMHTEVWHCTHLAYAVMLVNGYYFNTEATNDRGICVQEQVT